MHYAVPRILHRAGRLRHLFTDLCAAKGWLRVLLVWPPGAGPDGIRRLRDRRPQGIPSGSITAFTRMGMEYAARRRRARSSSDVTAAHLWAGRSFCECVLREGWEGGAAVYAFNSAALELLTAARRRGVPGILEQTIAPRAVEEKLLADERRRHPGWEEEGSDAHAAEFIQREQEEWAAASTILCASEFVRESVRACGGPDGRCVVVPYGVDAVAPVRRTARGGPLRVLTVGAVGLRKGTPYLWQAAARLGRRAVFQIAGPVNILPAAARRMAPHVELRGAIPRSELAKAYAWADVFLLPSLCEGSATAIYEALSAGLPVVCTPNAGSVVRDGVDGFIVPIRDADAIVERLTLLAEDASRRESMSHAAGERAQEYTLEQYGQRLLSVICPGLA